MSLPEYPVAPPPVPHRRNRLPALLVFLGGLIVLLALPFLAREIAYALTRGQERAKYEAAREQLDLMPDELSRYRLAAKVIEPSVVGIDTVRVVAAPAVADEWSFLPDQPRYEALGQGSGVIIDAAGYVLTNAHVINSASTIVVKLSDGRTVRNVQLVGADPLSDLAVLKIEASDLTPAAWGDSDQLEVGDQVLAVGNPFGLSRSVTAGIVSAKGRRVDVENAGFRDFLQTDAAVNPGNSGGPLVNLRGEVVGVNTAIVGHSYRGISFAIPSQLAQRVFSRLQTTGIPRGWIGVQMQDATPELAKQLGLPEAKGVIVTAVVPDSPAAAAGLRAGDVVVQLDDEPIRDSEDLRLVVARAKVGARLAAVVYRDGQKVELPIVVQQRPARLFGPPR